ncbi:MAG: putative zinc-binding protein [Candidatus Xenobiia bacterium LiM19]
MTEGKDSCSCKGDVTLIFPCSGGSDVGEITDRTARALTAQGVGRMYCLAGIGGHISGIVESTKSAEKILVLDGCPVNCARKTLEHAGIERFLHLSLSDYGIKKGESPADPEQIKAVVSHACTLLCK